MSRQQSKRSTRRFAARIVDRRPEKRSREEVTKEVVEQLSKKPQRRERLHARRVTLPPGALPLERAARSHPTAATPAMFALEREQASRSYHAYRGKPTNAASLPSGDPPDFDPAIELGDAIAQYAQDQSLTATAAYSRYAGEVAELALEALAAGGKPLRDVAMYLAKAGHLAEAGAMWHAVRDADRAIAAFEAKHNRQDQSYRASRRRSDNAEPLRESVKSWLKRALETNPTLGASNYARLLQGEYRRRLRRAAAARVPSERNLRRIIADLLPQLSKPDKS